MRCPDCSGTQMLVIAPLFEVCEHNLFGFRWIQQHRVGFIVRCTSKRCGQDWRFSLDGVTQLNPHAIPGRGALPPPVSANGPTYDAQKREREEREPVPPLGAAIRRPDL